MTSAGSDPIAAALRNYETVRTYRVTLRSKGGRSFEEIHYFYKSGYVRMEFVRPFPGAVLTYDPLKREVRLKPLQLADLVLTLSPDNAMVKSSAGHGVDESDLGSLLRVVEKLQSNGKTYIRENEDLSGRQTLFVRVTGNGDFTFRGIHRYDLWLDTMTCLPLKAVSYDLREEFIEEVLMADLETGLDLPDELFSL